MSGSTQAALDVYSFRNHIKYPVSCFHMPLAHYCRTLEDSIFDYRCPVLTLPAYCRCVDCTSPGLEQELRQQTGLIDHKEHSLSNSKNCRIELKVAWLLAGSIKKCAIRTGNPLLFVAIEQEIVAKDGEKSIEPRS